MVNKGIATDVLYLLDRILNGLNTGVLLFILAFNLHYLVAGKAYLDKSAPAYLYFNRRGLFQIFDTIPSANISSIRSEFTMSKIVYQE